MKRFNRVFALLAALAALLSLCACTSPNPERELARAQEKLRQLKSFRYDMDMDMHMSVGGTPVGVKTSCAAECVTVPLTLRLDISLGIDGPGELSGLGVDYTAYAVQDGDGCTAYMNMYGDWIKERLDGLGDLEQYDVRSGMDTYLSGLVSVTEAGSEEIDGVKAMRYDCLVGAEAIDEIMDSSGARSQLALLGLTDERAREMLSGLGEMPYSIWIDAKSSLPLRYELDMSGIMGALVDNIASDSGASFPETSLDKLILTVTLSGFDELDAIEIPDGALQAEEVSGVLSLFSGV